MKTTLVCDTAAQWLAGTQLEDPGWSPETWRTFQLVCRVHGIAPLLHEALQGTPWLPEPIRSWLAEQISFNRQRLTLMHRELSEVLSLYAQHNLPVIPLKGSVLSVEFYEDPAWRPMADIDLLVRPDDLEASIALLGQLNYEREVTHWKHIEFCRPDNRRVVSTSCEHPHNPRKLELHLHCRESFGGPIVDLTEMMWADSGAGTLLGTPVVLPRSRMLWLHLLVHCTYHLWQGRGRLIYLADLARIDLPPDVMDKMLAAVDARYTYPSLALLRQYFPSVVNESLMMGQQHRVSRRFRSWVDSLDLVNSSYLNDRPHGPYIVRALRFSEGRPREVARALRFSFLPAPDEVVLDHPGLARSGVPWLAYLLLPADWLKRALRRRSA